jgi:hypothetical protein
MNIENNEQLMEALDKKMIHIELAQRIARWADMLPSLN